MATAARILETAVLELRRIVRMARTRDGLQGVIVLAPGVRILENDGERGARGVSFVHAAEDVRLVGLHAGRGTLRAAPAASDVRREIRFRERKARRHAVDDHADLLSVRFAEDAHSENPSKSIHSLSNKSKNPGNDFATQATSSMSTGPSAPREATFRAMTMRWSPWDV